MRMRSGLLLVLAVTACAHGASSAAPAAPATAPAPLPPESAPTAVSPAPAPGPVADLGAAVIAAGSPTPEGMDWGDAGKQPARTLFKNAKVLGDLTGDRFMAAMQSMEPSLGVKCGYCHNKDDWASDEKDEKPTAREMMQMAGAINGKYFAGETRITCWTCHRANPEPARMDKEAAARLPLAGMQPVGEADLAKPSGQVFKNVQVLKDLPAGQLASTMQIYAAGLGVGCPHCHVEGKFEADDKPAKKRAREMMVMTGELGKDWFGGHRLGCFLCHKGKPEPARTARD